MDTPPDLSAALARVDALHADLEAMRPLEPDAVGRAMQRLRLEWTYHSNAIEGNSLTYGETRALLMEGVTAHGKPLKDHLDIERHGEVLRYIESFVQNDEPLRVGFVKEIHHRLMSDEYEIEAETADGARVKRTMKGGDYKELPNNVRTPTGEVHYYAPPLEVPGRMADLMDWLAADEAAALHPVARLAVFHHRFVEIHPFPDGNGRTGRVLMNMLLMRAGYVPAVLRQERRRVYYGALAEAGGGNDEPIIAFVAGELAETMELYVRALKGEPDPDAFSRRVALLKREVQSRPSREITKKSVQKLGAAFVTPLVRVLRSGMEQFAPLFESGGSQLTGTSTYQAHYIHEGGTDENAEQVNFSAAVADGSWIELHLNWAYSRLVSDPAVSLSASVVLEVEVAHLVVKTKFRERTYGGDSLPGEREAERIAQEVLDAAVGELEAQVRDE